MSEENENENELFKVLRDAIDNVIKTAVIKLNKRKFSYNDLLDALAKKIAGYLEKEFKVFRIKCGLAYQSLEEELKKVKSDFDLAYQSFVEELKKVKSDFENAKNEVLLSVKNGLVAIEMKKNEVLKDVGVCSERVEELKREISDSDRLVRLATEDAFIRIAEREMDVKNEIYSNEKRMVSYADMKIVEMNNVAESFKNYVKDTKDSLEKHLIGFVNSLKEDLRSFANFLSDNLLSILKEDVNKVIKELIGQFIGQLSERIDVLAKIVSENDSKMKSIELFINEDKKVVESLKVQIASLEQKLDSLAGGLEARLKELESRVANIEQRLVELDSRLRELDSRVAEVEKPLSPKL